MYLSVESTEMCRGYVSSVPTLQQILSSSSKESIQVVSDKEDKRIQASICLRLPKAKVHFGHRNFKLENVNEELFPLDLNIYAHFATCIFPTLSKIPSLSTGVGGRPRFKQDSVPTGSSCFTFITSFFSTDQAEFRPLQYPKLLSISR